MEDTLNLDSRAYRDGDYNGRRVGNKLFRDALAEHQRRQVRKLSVLADSYFQNDFLQGIMSASPGMDALLAAPALRRLEELRLELRAEFFPGFFISNRTAEPPPGAGRFGGKQAVRLTDRFGRLADRFGRFAGLVA
ncbi:hypothetical protein HU200_051963 [Digitaria exilis]|uniref:Uncharacterized protein n=1 Tax=Digitaria exilis TaxID=1010633 RepID=A0A835AQR1_9POAL|nr:hypothetical protein HU200_051963 [Digitaria exilis]